MQLDPVGSGAKSQPTKDLVHIQGQNNSSRSKIFVGFAEEKNEHFAKLKQKEAKDTLQREKQVRLEKRNKQKKHNKENAKKHHPARKIQMF